MKRDIYYIINKDNKYSSLNKEDKRIWTKHKYKAQWFTDLELATWVLRNINIGEPNREAKLKKETREFKSPKYRWVKL